MTIPTLHIDIEGGWGGSSRSLFELLSRLDAKEFRPLVLHRQEGPLQEWYRDAGIETRLVPEIGSFVPRRTKAAKNLLASLPRLRSLSKAADTVAASVADHEARIIHLNYEGLFLLARKIRKRAPGVPMIAHSRAHLPETPWGRWLARSLSRSADRMFYISPQEEARFTALAGDHAPPGEVIWNIARPAPPRLPFGDPPEAVYFGTLDWSKGTDRLIDIAAALEEMAAPPLRLVVYGKARTHPAFAAEMEARIGRENLSHRIAMRGYTTEPMEVMRSALALIRPSREEDPWGRDVIEAAASGLPVVASGTFDGVVANGHTGYLLSPFDPMQAAGHLVDLTANRKTWTRMSAAAQARAAERFGGAAQVRQFCAAVRALTETSQPEGMHA